MCLLNALVLCSVEVVVECAYVLFLSDGDFPSSVQTAKAMTLLNLASLYCLGQELEQARKVLFQVSLEPCVCVCVRACVCACVCACGEMHCLRTVLTAVTCAVCVVL